ncbi:MAG: YdcH family protein [Acidiferrobacterales bacterium]|nr:YdcH family protein [Acidiferrobacterales bacterium]
MAITQDEKQMLIQELAELKQEHRDLDQAIHDLTLKLDSNQFEISRLKKQKLQLKDAISRLESNLIPDLHA